MRSPDHTRLASQLPALYQDDAASYAQIDAFLGLADELSHAHLERLEDVVLQASPDAMLRWPPEVPLDAGADALLSSYLETYDEVASWLGFVFPAGWPSTEAGLGKRREVLARMTRLWRRRGTPRGFLDWFCRYFDVAETDRPLLVEHFKAPGPQFPDEPWTATLFVPSTAQFENFARRRESVEFVDWYAPAHIWIRVCFVAPGFFAAHGFLLAPPTLPANPTQDDVKTYAAEVVTHQKDLNGLLCSVLSVVSHANGVHIFECVDDGRGIDRLGVGLLPTDD
jgi:hypothetical protein